jgi:hypothetical protein
MAGKRRRITGAKKGWETRRKNEREKQRASKQRARAREQEKERIEKLLGEDFDTLAEARNALAEETRPPEPTTVEEWENSYDDFPEYEDQGEFEGGVET